MPPLNRREALRLGAVGVGAFAVQGELFSSPANTAEFSIHHDHILGTSFDAWFVGVNAVDADRVEQLALAEIERLRRIFSLYDSSSELSQLNRSRGAVAVSADLLTVLKHYQTWNKLTAGACNAGLGGITAIWESAAKQGFPPRSELLDAMARRINSPVFSVDGNLVTLLTDQPLNLYSVAKGYVLQKVSEVLRSSELKIHSGLLNLGGDMIAWGDKTWTLGIQDPESPADNTQPLTFVNLRNASIATSGGYLRNYQIQGVSHSHILDPRTGLASTGVAGATVIAPDSVTANVLATTLCVLGVGEGLKLVGAVAGAECLMIDSVGTQFRSTGFVSYESAETELQEPKDAKPDEKKDTKPAEKKDAKPGTPWPEDFEVKINLELPKPNGGRARRPYVAIWIEGADGKAVRTVSVWGSSPKWINTLSGWWKIGKESKDLVKAVSRATRSPGKYTVVWDGKDDAGKALPQGTYTIKIEVHREHGKDVTQSGKLECLAKPATLKLAENAETLETNISFAKKDKEQKDKK